MRNFLFLALLLACSTTFARTETLRWVGSEDSDSSLDHIITKINDKLGSRFELKHFQLLEKTPLSTSVFEMHVQVARGLPVHSHSIRIWKNAQTGKLVQMEARLEPTFLQDSDNRLGEIRIQAAPLSTQKSFSIVNNFLKSAEDSKLQKLTWSDEWRNGDLVRAFKVISRRGVHAIVYSRTRNMIVEHSYKEFPKADEFSVEAMVYPLFEESFGNAGTGQKERHTLNFLKTRTHRFMADPADQLRTRKYYEDMQDEPKSRTQDGWDAGYWSFPELNRRANEIYSTIPFVDNKFGPEGLVLDGRYVSVNLHPDFMSKKDKLNFPLFFTDKLHSSWNQTNRAGEDVYEIIPMSAGLPKLFQTPDELLNAPSRRLPNHDPIAYANDGFDAIQVYFATSTLMERLSNLGFNDPELSTRPFSAFLYDTDIGMQNNAYYMADTINFTTYSDDEPNLARDNTTIWHELGHGVMDRLMGPYLELGDVGGLSEGMADFVAQIIVEAVTDGAPFDGKDRMRIMNKIGFNFTNEVHDDGEAYGGTMRDFMDLALQKFGRPGLDKTTDLVLETMRLSRNHPALTSADWYTHLKYADELGGVSRTPGEMSALIDEAFSKRNFSMDSSKVARFDVTVEGKVLDSEHEGARERPVPLRMGLTDKKAFNLEVKIQDGDVYAYQYPVELRVYLRSGPLQGAVQWDGESDRPQVFTLTKANLSQKFNLTVNGKCEAVNREDGSCVDYAYIQLWDQRTKDEPIAKKRFYVRIRN